MEDKQLIKKFLPYLSLYKCKLVFLSFIMMFLLALSIIRTFLWGKLTLSIVSNSVYDLVECLFYLFIVFIFLIIFQIAQSKLSLFLKIDIINAMQKDIFGSVLNLDMQYMNNETKKGMFITRITSDVSQCVDAFILQFLPSVSSAISIFVIFFTMLKVNLYLSLISLSMLPLVIYLYVKKGKTLRKQQTVVKEKHDTVSSKIVQSLTYIKNIKILGIKDYTYNEFKKAIEESKTAEKKYGNTAILFSSFGAVLTIFIEFLIFLIGGVMSVKKIIGVDLFISFNGYYQQFYSHCNKVLDLLPSYQKVLVSLKRIDEISNSQNGNFENFGDEQLKNLENIQLSNVSFSYHEKTIFENVNFKIEKCGIYGIVGHSGAGKTTLINILCGLYKPSKGNVLINKKNILSYSEAYIRKNISVLSQEHYIFNGTILENFLCINKNLSQNEIENVCKACGIHDYIDSLPQKYNTIITENSTNLSEGQKQRISLARVVLTGAKLIILDEPISSLDDKSALIIKNMLDNIKHEKIIIIISHDYDILENADCIYEVLDKDIKTYNYV